ncbi:hypothetical protein VP01_29g6 [Puccinia sorghi]|uniref:SH3 domain-containing protein n=1 Tax=Puccinia sorghi TaxID=27349 RepID=A0A0L6V0G2_9BASI|nr:hypothetical protein VP01_29g6 [Puccinia sorghi]
MSRDHGAIKKKIASRSPGSPASPNPTPSLAELEAFDTQQRNQLEQFKHRQADARQREIARQNQMSANPAEAPSSPKPAPSSDHPQAQSAPRGATHIIAQPVNPSAHLPSKNDSSPAPIASPARASPSNNSIPLATSLPATTSRSASNSTLVTSHPPSSSQSAAQVSPNPQSIPRNTTASPSLVPPAGVSSGEQANKYVMTTGTKVLLAFGVLSAIFLVGYFISWWLRRRHLRQNSPRKLDKFSIKGPFKKCEESQADTDSKPIFGRPGHAGISVDHLQVFTEITTPARSDPSTNPRLLHPTPMPPPATRSPLTFQPNPAEITPLPNLNSISPLSHFNKQTPSDYRCQGPQMKGKTFIVERTYQAALDDELVLHVGDRIEVVFHYDDGWCLGRNLDIEGHDKGQLSKGVFPRDCVGAQPVESSQETKRSSDQTHEWDLASSQTTINDIEEESRRAFRAISSNPSLSPLSSSIFEKFPLPPRSYPKLEAQQRVSSLFIGRNTQLFSELDDALGRPLSPPHVQFTNPPHHVKQS